MALSQNFHQEKRKELGEKLAKDSLALIYSGREIIMSADRTYPFYPNNNFNYLTGIEEDDVVLLLQKDREGDLKETLYLREIDAFKERWEGLRLRPGQAQEISGISKIRERKALIEDLVGAEFKFLYLDHQVPAGQNLVIDDQLLKERLQQALIYDLHPFFQIMRLIKTAEEIKMIKAANQVTKKAFEKVRSYLKAGIFEYELAAYFEYQIKKEGASGLAFDTIVASGENATTLHYIKNNKKLKAGELVLFDLGARLNNYCADISRTLAVTGEMTRIQADFYQIVETVQTEMIKAYQPGASLKELQKQTTELLASLCREKDLFPESGEIKDYYYHNIGHSLGMDTHDLRPAGDLILKAGMVMTVEPGIYVKKYGLGIRIEDDLVITEDGCEVF